ncbi:MAG: DUF58 domain-containing protein [Proteobacteria bacterium]|nr:DUF58 domain-containing protein [Pseudomonadota bacterium]
MSRLANFSLSASRLSPLVFRLLAPFRALRAYVDRWLFQLGGPATTSLELVQRRIFILPSRHGMLFVGALALMLTGSINYNLSLGFVLTFLLGGLGVNSILHTFRNLARLRIAAGRVLPVYAGDTARFTLIIDNPGALDRYSIGITRGKPETPVIYVDVPAQQSTSVGVPVPAPHRGVLRPGRFTIFTHFPLGLCYAWAYAELDMHCIVYPRPEPGQVPLPQAESHDAAGVTHGAGQEDFAGLRSYHPGDSPRHIAWKAAARGDALLTKQFSGRAASELWLDWAATPDTLGVEARLSRLARWVVDAHAAALSFGMRLPGITLPPAPGDAQREHCLEALALFQGKKS